MSTQRQSPNGVFLNETDSKQYQAGGYAYINEVAVLTPAPTGTITSQPAPDGQNQQFVGTATDATSGSYTLTGSNGGITVTGTFTITAGSFDFTVTGLNPGDYSPTLTVTGNGGTAGVSGTTAFSIASVNGDSELPSAVSASIKLVDDKFLPLANLTGLSWAWFDEVTPNLFSTPTNKATGGVTDANGVFTVSMPNSALAVGQVGWLIVTNSDGNPATQHMAFSGPVAVQ